MDEVDAGRDRATPASVKHDDDDEEELFVLNDTMHPCLALELPKRSLRDCG
jgi:hypothetical protein